MKTLKQTLALILAVFCLLTATACGARSGSVLADNNTIADETFGQILQAIEENDASRIVSLFSPAAQSEQENIHEEAEKLIDFIKGDTVSHTSAEKSGVGARIKKDNGKTHKNIQSSFTLETTEGTYYIAIKECVQDEFDGNNVGVMSFYIIEEKNWDTDYIYRAGGATEMDLGIHIELEAREPATD